MEKVKESRKELTYDQVQRIIDEQIARIEGQDKNGNPESSESSKKDCAQEGKVCPLRKFFRRVFGKENKENY